VVSSGGSFVSAVTGQMTYPVASLKLDSARSYVMQGASFTKETISNIPIGGSISPEGFVSYILLLVVIIVTVVIIVVILVVVLVAIVGVVIVVAIIGVVVVVCGGVSPILKISFMIIGLLRKIVFYYLLHQSLGYGNSFFQGWAYAFHQDKASSVRVPVANVTLFSSAQLLRENTDSDIMEILEFKTSKYRYGDNRMSDSIGGLMFLVTKVGENRMHNGDVSVCRVDGEWVVAILVSGKRKKNVPLVLVESTVVKSPSENSDNTRGTTVGEAIGACSGGIGNSLVASYVCMASIYGSSCKDEKTSVAKRYLVKSFEESGEVFPGEAGK
nr:hypothetical protein [Tanacetum cinerariifolium]